MLDLNTISSSETILKFCYHSVFSAKKIELIPRSEEKGTSIEALFFAVFSGLVLRSFPHHQSIGPWGNLQETLVTIPEKWDMSMFFPWISHGFLIFFMEQKHDLTRPKHFDSQDWWRLCWSSSATWPFSSPQRPLTVYGCPSLPLVPRRMAWGGLG